MLRPDINDMLTQTGPGTPMGDLFRRYWQPVLHTEELPEDGCPPVRVKILSERLIAVRTPEGEYGLMDEFCAHRGVSMFFARVESGGIRCPYHGWKYNAGGQAIEVPSELNNSEFCKNVKLRSYPLVKVGDLLWAYLGDPEKQPPLPSWEFATVPSGQTFTSKRFQESNWLQALEGGIDSSHVTWLHGGGPTGGGLEADPLFAGAKGNQYNKGDVKPSFEVVENEGGLLIGARRNAEEGHYYWRVTPWVLPNFTLVPPRGDHPVHGHFWVPIDDENCWAWSFDYHPTRDLTEAEVSAMEAGAGVHSKNIPGTYLPEANKENDYLIDREKQKSGELFSGVEGIAIQDSSLQESMGPIVDRTKERLVATDAGIIKARQKLRRVVEALRDHGTEPMGNIPEHQNIRSVAIVLPADQPFVEGIGNGFEAREGVRQTTV
ncbi:Rieske 2Fe-2S domain-containing protein [Nesterenkonia sp. CF4.4]|uniref:Rieske 2Fe-2S domain-containing protein n=1 Tax=Nesterenkonia sp. CF4.4 TaxID=3373079 RepID=UPI003EE58818